MDKFFINPLSIIFLSEIDKENYYQTIACNWDKEEYLKISPSAYEILKTINDKPGISLEKLTVSLKIPLPKLYEFLRKMISLKVVVKE